MTTLIDLQIASKNQSIPSELKFNLWVSSALDGLRDDGEVSIRVVEPDEIRQLNDQYRSKNKTTNILSFPFEIPEGVPKEAIGELLGDLIICADVVTEEAKSQQKPVENHWAHMVIHGTLHLIGYDHVNDADAEIMEQMERDILARLQIPDPYRPIIEA